MDMKFTELCYFLCEFVYIVRWLHGQLFLQFSPKVLGCACVFCICACVCVYMFVLYFCTVDIAYAIVFSLCTSSGEPAKLKR